jgi:epoxyqueuosine reductase
MNLANHHTKLAQKIKSWGIELGFSDVKISHCDLSQYETEFFNWIGQNNHGEMKFLEAHGTKRTRPNELLPGTQSIISVRMNYFHDTNNQTLQQLKKSAHAYVSRYALGKDYHKLMRKRLNALALKIQHECPDIQYRAFSDSAPVLETAIAEQAGHGFIGKNTLMISPEAGSWFFLGELYLSIELPSDPPITKQGCGPCTACIDECPTQAILENNHIDARRCVSYLTIESDQAIPLELRPLIGNRIYGCDDCQLVCPWNKFIQPSNEVAFESQYQLDNISLIELLHWDEMFFLKHFEGSAIRRIGFEKWQRNLAVASGNCKDTQMIPALIQVLQKITPFSTMTQEHIEWAINQLLNRKTLDGPGQNIDLTPIKARKYFLPQN